MVRAEQYAFCAIFAQPQRPSLLVELVAAIDDLDVAPNIDQVPRRVHPEVGGAADPDVLPTTPGEVVENDPGNLPAFPDSRAVPEEEPGAAAVVQHHLVPLAGVHDALELQLRQPAPVDDPLRDRVEERVDGLGQRHRSQRGFWGVVLFWGDGGGGGEGLIS